MKSLQVLIAIAIIAIEILGVSAANASPIAVAVAVASGMLKTTGIGQLDFGLTYEGTPTVTNPTVTATNNGALLAFVQGASITNADDINSYMWAQADGGDTAEAQLDVVGKNGHDATVQNYNMYGYVTSNFAYAGQYADKITGESIDMNAQSWNSGGAYVNPTDQASEQGNAAPGTIAPSYLGSVVAYTKDADSADQGIAGLLPATGTNSGASYVEKKAVNSGSATDTSQSTIATVYQFAQAGGSADPSAYPMGTWTQAVNDKGAKMTSVTGGSILDKTGTIYFGTNSLYADASASMTYSGAGTLTSSAQEMGYADSSTVYANKDSLMSGNANTPFYSTTSSTDLSGTPHASADTGGNTPCPSWND